jgi:hypothetical protein
MPAQITERDWRQAMPRVEPALSLTPLSLSAVIEAALTTGITTTTVRLTWCYYTLTATTLCTHGPKGRSGGAASDGRPDHNWAATCLDNGLLIAQTITVLD